MTWDITDRFPDWGETGESPPTGFFYEGGDQVNEKHLDYLWNSVKGLEDDVQSALNDIDSDGDGVVNEADTTTNFDEDAQDAVASLVTSDPNLSWSYDDSANTLTISLADSVSANILEATDELGNPTYPTLSDVPTNLPEGTQVYVEDENAIYVEDGT